MDEPRFPSRDSSTQPPPPPAYSPTHARTHSYAVKPQQFPTPHTPWATPSPDGRVLAMPSGDPAELFHQLAGAAETDRDEAPGLARALAACLSPEVRLVLLRALAGPDCEFTFGAPELAVGAPEFLRAPRKGPPDGLIRLRFADVIALERAGAVFGAGAGPESGDAWSDPATLTLQIAGDAGIETLRAVLAVLDAAAITAESLTVHTHELDDVFAAFTGLP